MLCPVLRWITPHKLKTPDIQLTVLEDCDMAAEQAFDPLFSDIILSLRDPSCGTARPQKHICDYKLCDACCTEPILTQRDVYTC